MSFPMWKISCVLVGLAFAVLMLVPSPARAQAGVSKGADDSGTPQPPITVSVSGTVVDDSGGAVVGAVVRLTDAAGIERSRVQTNAAGTFVLSNVTPGAYSVTVERELFETARVDLSVAMENKPLRIVLGVAGVREAITVDAPGYRSPPLSAATRTGAPLLETPMAISSVPRAVMSDQRSARLKDALENVASVRPAPSLQVGTGYFIRGFADGRRIFRNGLLGTPTGFRSEFDAALIERAEVLKGPASVLYGRLEPGGVINLVTKRPLAIPTYAVEQEVGSFATLRTVADATGPLTSTGTLLYRAIGGYQNGGSFRDFGESERLSGGGALTWRPRPGTELTAEVEGAHQSYIADFGLPVVGDRPADIPTSRSFGDPNDPEDEISRVNVGWELSQRLTGTWLVRNRFMMTNNQTRDDFVNPAPAFGNALRADGRTLDRNIFYQESDGRIYATNAEITGSIPLGRVRHQVLAGGDLIDADTDYRIFGNFTTPNPALAIDIFNPAPSYRIDPSLFRRNRDVPAAALNHSRIIDENRGLYFEDRIDIGAALHVLVGGRYDWARAGRGRGTSDEAASSALDNSVPSIIRRDEKFTSRVGVVVQPVQSLSLYGSWATSFGANNGVTAAGVPHPPQEGAQVEGGVKAELAGRLFATLAVYDLTRKNLLTPDLSTADPFDSIAIGEAKSRGVEIDVTGRIARGLDIIASYAYTDGEVSRDNSGLQGRLLSNIPRHAGSVWLHYDFGATPLALGGGVFAAGDRQGDPQNTFVLENYARLDLMTAYRWQVAGSTLIGQLNVRNVLDKTYYESTDPNSNVAPRSGVYPGSPRGLTATLRFEF